MTARSAAAVALTCLALGACGGDGDQAASPTPPPPQAPVVTTPQQENAASGEAPCTEFDGVAAEACQDAYDLCQVSGEQAIADEYAAGDIDAAAEEFAEASYAPAAQPAAQAGCLAGFAESE